MSAPAIAVGERRRVEHVAPTSAKAGRLAPRLEERLAGRSRSCRRRRPRARRRAGDRRGAADEPGAAGDERAHPRRLKGQILSRRSDRPSGRRRRRWRPNRCHGLVRMSGRRPSLSGAGATGQLRGRCWREKGVVNTDNLHSVRHQEVQHRRNTTWAICPGSTSPIATGTSSSWTPRSARTSTSAANDGR